MCPFVLDLKCEACFFTDWRQVSNHVGYVSLCMKIPVMVFPELLAYKVTGPLPTAWQLGGPQQPNPKISSEMPLPLPCTLLFQVSNIRNIFLLRSPFPGCSFAVKRNMSSVLWGWCHRPLCRPHWGWSRVWLPETSGISNFKSSLRKLCTSFQAKLQLMFLLSHEK